jgi:hypothetical protein
LNREIKSQSSLFNFGIFSHSMEQLDFSDKRKTPSPMEALFCLLNVGFLTPSRKEPGDLPGS